jgi:putative transposase
VNASPKTATVKSINFEEPMKKSKFTETQIVSILSQHEKGMKVTDICREHGVSQATFYQWQRKYGGMSVADLKRLKELEADLSLAQRVVAELTMQNRILKDVIEKKL